MRECICICIYVHTSIHTYIYYLHTYIYVYIFIHIYTYIFTCIRYTYLNIIYICTYMSIYVHIYTYIDIYTHTHIYIYTHTHIYIYIHTHIYMCVYICVCIYMYICVCIYINNTKQNVPDDRIDEHPRHHRTQRVCASADRNPTTGCTICVTCPFFFLKCVCILKKNMCVHLTTNNSLYNLCNLSYFFFQMCMHLKKYVCAFKNQQQGVQYV